MTVYSARAIRVYACPSDPRALEYYLGNQGYGTQGLTDYLAVTGTMTFAGDPTTGLPRPKCDGVIYENANTRLTDISDGTSNTVLVGERPPSLDLFWGWWTWPAFDACAGGTQYVARLPVFADGAVQLLPQLNSGELPSAHDRQLRHAPLLEHASRRRQLALRRRLGTVLAISGERDFAGPGDALWR